VERSDAAGVAGTGFGAGRFATVFAGFGATGSTGFAGALALAGEGALLAAFGVGTVLAAGAVLRERAVFGLAVLAAFARPAFAFVTFFFPPRVFAFTCFLACFLRETLPRAAGNVFFAFFAFLFFKTFFVFRTAITCSFVRSSAFADDQRSLSWAWPCAFAWT
jgi:hypothetical protein